MRIGHEFKLRLANVVESKDLLFHIYIHVIHEWTLLIVLEKNNVYVSFKKNNVHVLCPRRVAYSNRLLRSSVSQSVRLFVRSITLKLCKAST